MYLLFAFFSGFTSLVYEIIWMRYLVLVLGNTVQATALTVAVFIGGLGIGAIIFGSAADRSKNHLKLFSKIQFGAGISSLLTLFVLSNLPKIYMFFNNQEIVFSRLLTLSLGCSFILIPAIFTGGAFPALAKGLIRQKKMIKRQLGLIYSVNTFGSIIGIFVTAFALIRLIGMAGAQIVAILLSFLIAVGAYFRSSVTDSNESPGTSVTVRGSEMLPTKYVIIAFIVGFNSLGLEILWTRIINIYLPNTTYGFATVLIIFLGGISLGSYVYGRFLSSRFNAHFLLAFSQMMIGFYILLSTLIVNKIPLLLVIFKPIMNIAMIRLFLPGITVIAVLSFIPTLFIGISFPALIALCTANPHHLGKRIGTIFFTNIAGNIIGSVITGFVMIGILGVIRGMTLLAMFVLFVSFYLLILTPFGRRKSLKLYFNSFLIICSFLMLILKIAPTSIVPPSLFDRKNFKILLYHETSAGTVIVSEEIKTGIKACHVNNSAVIGTAFDALITVKMLGYLPCFYKPNPQSALIIGFGTGVTASVLARHNIKTIDCVEICPGVRKAAAFFSEFNDSIIYNTSVNFINGDGRIYVLESKKTYDIISCDPTHPILGSNNLYTREYFEFCKQKLNENGIICQYLPLHKLSDQEFKILVNTFAYVFPECSIWLAHSHGIMIGSTGNLSIDFKQIEENIRTYPDQYLDDPFFIGACFMIDAEQIKKLTINTNINSDDHPILEFFSPACLKAENWHENFTTLLSLRISADKIFNNIKDLDRFNRYWIGNHYFFASLIHKSRGELQEMMQTLNYALSINPENKIINNFYAAEIRRFKEKSPIDN